MSDGPISDGPISDGPISDGPVTLARDGVRVAIRLTPRGRANRLVAVAAGSRGGHVVTACVTAPPEDGRANEALLRLLARTWRLPRRDLSIVAGAASRNKTVRIAGAAPQLIGRLAAEIATLPGR